MERSRMGGAKQDYDSGDSGLRFRCHQCLQFVNQHWIWVCILNHAFPCSWVGVTGAILIAAAAGEEDYVSYDDAMPSVDDLEVAAAAAEAPPMHHTLIGQGAALQPGAAWRSIGGAAVASTSSDEVRHHHATAIVLSCFN